MEQQSRIFTRDLSEVAPHFVDMAHAIVWASVATVDASNRPRSRVLHPIWEWDGQTLTGWVATGPTKAKREDLAYSPYASVNYWAADQNTCTAECRAELVYDLEIRKWLWDWLKTTPMPLGYDPAIIPAWNDPSDAAFAALKLEPYRLRVFPGQILMGQPGTVRTWVAS